MTDVPDPTVQSRVEAVILGKFGRTAPDLTASGIVDSLSAMELLVLLQDEFAVKLQDVTVQDMSTVARIVSVVETAVAAKQ